MKKRSVTGLLCVLGSAVIFGFTPVLAAISYQGGNNGINMAFLRASVPLPLLLLIGWGLPKPTGAQWKKGLLAGCALFGCTLLLYSSYEYISPGLATTLHFLYPLYVIVYEAIRLRRSPGKVRIAALLIGLLGSTLFLENSQGGSLMGFILALGSGVAYAVYINVLGSESRNPMPLYRLMLLVSIGGAVLCGATGLVMGKLTFTLTGTAWICAICVAVLTAIVGCVLFQRGVREVGEANAALFSLLEPITSVLFSVWLLHDSMSLQKILGSILIISSLFIISLHDKKQA